jgi:hypothetical protein
MKKSSFVILTIVAALSLSGCAVPNAPQNVSPPDPMYADVDPDVTSDSTRQYAYNNVPAGQYPVIQFDYYYRSYFFDDMYRCFFPRRYYSVITKPGYVPRHKRPVGEIAVHRSRSLPASSLRGGFGRTGSIHSIVS